MAEVLFKSIMFLLNLLEFLLIVRCMMSWLYALGSANSFSTLVYDLTEFLLEPVRELLDRSRLRLPFIDLSPVIVGFLIEVLKRVVVSLFAFALNRTGW